MLVIQLANGNTYPAETCVWRTTAAANGGYKITHFSPNSASVAVTAAPTAVGSTGARLGYIGKSGRFVAYTEAP
ncbi:hypothetical protein OAV41_02115 [Planctomycetota bacterium]|nr:hypothetical protein [Planctomycetota bacterium]